MKKIFFLCSIVLFSLTLQAQDERIVSSLFKAVYDNDMKEIVSLITKNEDVNVYDATGVTPLTIACGIGNYEIASYLLENGANPDLVSNQADAYTPLTQAVHSGKLDIVKLLIYYGADPEAGYTKTIIAKTLISDGATQEQYPLYIARDENQGEIYDYLDKVINESIYPKSSHVVRYLIKNGEIAKARDAIKDDFGVDGHDYQGRTTLMVAAHDVNYSRIIDLAIEYGADVSAKDKYGNTLLHHFAMCRTGREDGIKECIKNYKLIIDEKNNFGNTPLSLASWSQCPENIELLIEAGADVNSKDEDGLTPLLLALKRGKTDDHDAYESVETLLKYKADPNIPEPDGSTPLIYAIWKHLEDCTKLLLKNGADINMSFAGGFTPLHQTLNYADEGEALNMLKLLLSFNPKNINEKSEGLTPVAYAKEKGLFKCAELLEEAGGIE